MVDIQYNPNFLVIYPGRFFVSFKTMKSPFRKLVRIAVVLLAAVLLFNFFGYYMIHLSSKQNEKW